MVLSTTDDIEPNAAITPPHSVINVLDFSEPKELAVHLTRLLSNETEYLSYFWWKEFYKVEELMPMGGHERYGGPERSDVAQDARKAIQ